MSLLYKNTPPMDSPDGVRVENEVLFRMAPNS
jgi:hypothetical protein